MHGDIAYNELRTRSTVRRGARGCSVFFVSHARQTLIACSAMIIILRPSMNACTIDSFRQQEVKIMLGNVAVFFCSWLLASSTALPLGIQPEAARAPRSGFATAKHALIIGCDGLGKFLIAQKIYTI